MNPRRPSVDKRTRALSLLAVAVLHAAGIAALVKAFGVEVVVARLRAVAAFDVPLPPPPPPPPMPPSPPPPPPRPEPVRAKPKPVPRPSAAPTLPAPRVEPPETAAPAPESAGAPLAPPAPMASAGAGSGPGAGGSGSDAGAGAGGGAGNGGDRGGSPGVVASRAQKIAGELTARDFPRSSAAERNGRFVTVRYSVGADGRVANCRVSQPSGDPEADRITCRLIEQRFRYRPALDATGNPVPDVTGWKQWWWQ